MNYLNTLPLLYGLEQGEVMGQMELTRDYPARIAQSLQNGEIDLALLPVAAIPDIPGAQIVSDYGISCDGPVASVCLFSQVPLPDVRQVILDYQSKTSVQLLRILFREYWKREVEWIAATEDFEDRIQHQTAGLLIGDRCLRFRHRAAYIYDLGEAWKAFTGLPFVFAAWVSRRPLPAGFIQSFNTANARGVQQIDRLIARHKASGYDLTTYFTKNIRYHLDSRAFQGLERFQNLR